MSKKILRSVVSVILIGMVVIAIMPATGNVARAISDASSWVRTDFDLERKYEVKTQTNWFWNIVKQSENCYWAYGIEQDTLLGSVYQSVNASRSEDKTLAGAVQGVEIGSVYFNAYDISVTVKPVNKLKVKGYQSKYYSFSVFSNNNMMSSKTYYVGTDNLETKCYVPHSKSTGFLCNWSPRQETGIDGFDNIDVSFGINLSDTVKPSISIGTKISITDDYVDGADKTNVSTGLYWTKYDYKKYNKIGLCTPGRKKVIFGTTTVHNSVLWVNKSINYSGYVYSTVVFTLCDSDTWPTEIQSITGKMSSKLLRIGATTK